MDIVHQLEFVGMQSAAALIAVALAEPLLRRQRPGIRLLGAAALFPVVATLGVLIVGLSGGLFASAVLALLIPVAVVLAFIWVRNTSSPGPGLPQSSGPGSPPWIEWAALGLLFAFAALWVSHTLLGGTMFSVDDLCYHAQTPTDWMRAGRLLPTMGYWESYPKNAETFSLWFMLPWRLDAFAGVSGFYWGVVASLGVGILAGEMGGSRLSVILAAAAALALPQLTYSSQSFDGVDVAGPAMVIAGLVFLQAAVKNRGDPPIPSATSCCLLSGLFMGFAAGCKVAFLPGAAFGFCYLIYLWIRKRGGSAAHLGVFVVGAVLTGGLWYARNTLYHGNPFYPGSLGPFKGPWSPQFLAKSKLIWWVVHYPTSLPQWLMLIRDHLNWPISFAIVSLAACVSAAWFLCRGRGTDRLLLLRPNVASVMLIGLVFALTYPMLPFSATNLSVDVASPRVQLRFIILPMLLGFSLLPLLVDLAGRAGEIAVAFVFLTLVTGWRGGNPEATYTTVVAILLFVGWFFVRNLQSRAAIPSACLAVLVVISILLAVSWRYRVRKTDDFLFTYGSPQEPIGAAWRQIDQLPSGSHIMVVQTASECYPLNGRRLQHVWVALAKSFVMEHTESPTSSPADLTDAAFSKAGNAFLLHAILEQQPDYVLVTRWRSNQWPAARDVLARSSAEKIYDDNYSTIWRIKR